MPRENEALTADPVSDENALREAALLAAHRTYCECPEPDRVDRQIADAVLAAVVPLVREQVATEIEAAYERVRQQNEPFDGFRQAFAFGAFQESLAFAARIARGGSR